MKKPLSLVIISVVLIVYGLLMLCFSLIGAQMYFKEVQIPTLGKIIAYIGFTSYILSVITGVLFLFNKKNIQILLLIAIAIKSISNIFLFGLVNILNGGVLIFLVCYLMLTTSSTLKNYLNK